MASRDETARRIAIMQAFVDGKVIQFRPMTGNTWGDVVGDPLWTWDHDEYRVKPEPREWWINRYEDGKCAMHTSKYHAEDGAKASLPFKSEMIHVREVID